MDTLIFNIIEDRFTLFAVPISLCGLIQLSGAPFAAETLGLPVGQTTKILSDALHALLDASFFRSSRSTSSLPHQDRTPFPDKESWRPVILHAFVHRDFSHFSSNLVMFIQSVSVMKFPSFAARKGWQRGTFFTSLLAVGALFSTLAMDASAKYDTRKVKEKNSHGIALLEWMIGSARETQLSRSMLVGASGAIMSLIGYNATFSPSIPTGIFAVMTIGNDLFSELTRPHGEFWVHDAVAYAGHLGGFFFGALVGGICNWSNIHRWLRDYREHVRYEQRQQQGRVLGTAAN